MILCCALLMAAAWGQSGEAPPTFQTGTNVVLIPAVVRDEQGNSVPGLRREDFQVTEDGKARTVIGVDVEMRNRGVASSFPQQFDAYLFDDLHLGFRDWEQARSAFAAHLGQTKLTGRRVAIFTASGSLTTPFTDSREALLDAVHSIQPIAGIHTGTECPDISYYVAHRISRLRDRSALASVMSQLGLCLGPIPPAMARGIIENEVSRVLRVETQAVQTTFATMRRMLGNLERKPGSRSIILVSAGSLIGDDKERTMLSGILTQASRHRIAVSAVNAHGLHGINWNLAKNEISNAQVAAAFRNSADWLVTAAEETGGTYIGNSNDLKAGLRRIAEPVESMYYLAVRVPEFSSRGKVHKIEVKVPGRRGVSVQARSSYEDSAPLTASDHVRAVLYSGADVHPFELTMVAERTPESKLRVAAGVNGADIPLRETNGVHVNSITVGYGIFDRNGGLVGESVRAVDMRLKESAVPRLRADGFRLGAEFDVAPGTYLVRIAVREAGTGKVASLGRMVTVSD